MLGITSKRDKILNPYRKEAIAAVGRYINAVAEKFPDLKIEKAKPHSAGKTITGGLESYFSISGDTQPFSEEIEKFRYELSVSNRVRNFHLEVTTDADFVKAEVFDFYDFGTKELEGMTAALNKATDKLKFGDSVSYVDVAARRADQPSDVRQLGI